MNRFAIALAGLLLATVPCTAGDRYTEPADCDAPSADEPVCFHDHAVTPAEAAAALGLHNLAVSSVGDELTVIARSPARAVSLCCSIDAPLKRIEGSTDLWSLSVRVLDIEHAVIDAQLSTTDKGATAYYGNAVPRPVVSDPLKGTLQFETIASTALGEDRKLTVYLPPGHDKTRTYPVLYMADGDVVSSFVSAIDALIAAGRIRPLIVIGLWPGRSQADERSLRISAGPLRAALPRASGISVE